MYKAEILHYIDLTDSKLNHVSISGSKATHSLAMVETITSDTLDNLKAKIKNQYGEAYDTNENSMYLTIPENEWDEGTCPENYEAIITLVNEEPVIL